MGNSSMELPANLEVLLDIPVKVTVELGACQLSMQEVLQLGPGSVMSLDKRADAPVDLFVNQKLVARGEVVVMDDQFGIRITEIVVKSASEQPSIRIAESPAAAPSPAASTPAALPAQPAPAAPPAQPVRSTAPAAELSAKQF